jgi:hypothetical protein
MSALIEFSVGLARGWTATYTRGLPRECRVERIEEIDSDLWDQRRFAERERQPVAGTAAEVFARTVLGMPADVLWRIETGSTLAAHRRNTVNTSLAMRIGMVSVTILLVALVFNGISIVFGAGEWDSRGEQVAWGLVFAACPLLAIVGLWLSANRPKLGIALVVVGVVLASLVMFWMAFIIVPVGLAVIALAIRRSGLAIWPIRGAAAV